jgi:hypothetical protein
MTAREGVSGRLLLRELHQKYNFVLQSIFYSPAPGYEDIFLTTLFSLKVRIEK